MPNSLDKMAPRPARLALRTIGLISVVAVLSLLVPTAVSRSTAFWSQAQLPPDGPLLAA